MSSPSLTLSRRLDCIEVDGDVDRMAVPLPVLRALLEAAGYTIRDREQETRIIGNVADIVGERDAARAEVARLRALCEEASWATDERELTARLAAAGKGEGSDG